MFENQTYFKLSILVGTEQAVALRKRKGSAVNDLDGGQTVEIEVPLRSRLKT